MIPARDQGESRTPEQLREHYVVERELADRLRRASRPERRRLYASVYDELFRRVPSHPQLTRKASPEESRERTARQIRPLLGFLGRDSVFLEVGAGDCSLSFEVARRVRQVYAVDVSEEIARGATPPPNFRLVLSDGRGIPLPPESVDVAYSNQLMEHLHPDDALEQLRSLHEVLRPGGIYFCVTPNRLSGPHDISRYFDPEATGLHLREYTVADLRRLFAAVGFSRIRTLVRVGSRYVGLPVFPLAVFEKLLSLLPRRWRLAVAGRAPIQSLLGVRLVGRKRG